MTFLYNLPDPATVYAFSMVLIHHDVMWFIFIILGVVYWTLFKILVDFGWNVGNKQSGLLRLYYYSRYITIMETLYVQLIILGYKVSLFEWQMPIPALLDAPLWILCYLNGIKWSFIEEFFAKSLWIIFGSRGIFCWVHLPEIMNEYVFTQILTLIKNQNLDHVLFSYTNHGEYFYDERLTSGGLYDFTDEGTEFLMVNRFKHSTFLEFVWASFPTVIIILILIPSLFLLYSMDEDLHPLFTLKVVGHQWFWSYEYADWIQYDASGEIKKINLRFDSCLVLEDDLRFGTKRLLEVDKRVVLPLNISLRFLITSGDVLHAWSVPEMGIKVDAVPGRLNQFLTLLRRPGVFYGQCSELCGVAHGFMPIVVQGVPIEVYEDWLS